MATALKAIDWEKICQMANGRNLPCLLDGGRSAESEGQWTLVGCTVAPGFEFDKFELAPKDWHPVADGI